MALSPENIQMMIKDMEYDLNYLKNIDILIDGKFELDKRDITLKLRGSTNQRIIDVKEYLNS